MNNKNKIALKLKLLLCLSAFTPGIAFANTSGFELQSILQGLVNLLNSGVARTIFVLAIIGVGYGWIYMGQIPKNRAIGAIVGIGIVFSASYIAQQLGVGA